jgi:hypothetical protein
MSTVYYPCAHCDVEIGSAQDIVWENEKPFHPDCVEFEAIRATALAIAGALAVLEERS